jgi:hypothetical protein
MPLRTILSCPRCDREDPVEGQVNPAAFDTGDGFRGWRNVFATLLCPDCVKAVQDFVAKAAAPKRDAGFADGRPAPKGSVGSRQ